jgi:hypothetical protein
MVDAQPATLVPSRLELYAMAAAAVAFRVAVFACVTLWFGVPLDRYVAKGDTTSYLANARAMLGDAAGMTEYDRRVFPGYPGLIAVAGAIGIPLPWAALGITWLSAGVAATGAAALFGDRRVGWAMVALLPHYTINSAIGMTEAPLLALCSVGLLLARGGSEDGGSGRGRAALAGMLLGSAGLVRPVACFAVLGAIAADLVQGRRARALVLGAVAAVVVLAGFLALHAWTGDATRGVRVYANDPGAYGGQMFVWPFKSVIFTPLYDPQVSAARVVYIWAHVLLTLGAIALLARRCMRRPSVAPDALALTWLTGNTAFVLCIGSYWGFHHFPRFIIPAMPALFWAWRGALPDRWYLWAPLFAGVFVTAAIGVNASP